MTFSEDIRKAVDPIWEASFHHPFVKGIGEGNLSLEQFRYYVLQDSYYLSHFARVQAMGAAKAEDMKTMASMASHAQSTYEAEMALHKDFSKRLGITEEERNQFKPASTAYAYASHMYRGAFFGDLGEIIATILPCYWLYYEVGAHLQGYKPKEPIYQDWIAAYGGEWFRKLVEEQIQRLDELAALKTEAERERMKELFVISSQYEYQFWEMAYQMEEWPFDLKASVNAEKENKC
ncbi:thiaminase/transcriptional activator TenA [Bacillus ectoiniformans]|uniref:thiaminase II n=1 Tax=Bacillus ectoiniformans TaxID=1494429 RepID=UPI001957A86A|nr:thiaminase/transcriptional activator TenA [Bacillus ectoiniformans]